MMSENTQSLAIFSDHHLSFSASATVNVKAGYKLENGEFKPHTEASGSMTSTISVGSSIFRANSELSRRYVLATIVGPGKTGEQYYDWNVKEIGIMKYYFVHYQTIL